MSSMMLYICDKCKKEHRTDRIRLPEDLKKIQILSDYNSPEGKADAQYDLCKECVGYVRTFIEKGLEGFKPIERQTDEQN